MRKILFFVGGWCAKLAAIVIAPFYFIFSFLKNIASPLDTQEKTESEPEYEKTTPDRNIVFSGKRTIFQIFETLSIIESSSNIETVESRLDLLHGLLSCCEESSKYKGWTQVIEDAESTYLEAYYDKKVTPAQKQAASYPSSLLNEWHLFYNKSLFECVKRYAQSQDKFIAALKTKKAKENRIQKVIQLIEKVKEGTNSDEILKKLDDLQSQIRAMV
jgi:hypothetical protein